MKNFFSLIFLLLGIAQQYVNGQQLPAVVTKKIYNIAPEGAYVNSEVTSDGGAFVSERGIWWDWQPDYTKSTSQLRKMRSDTGKGSYTTRIIFATGQQGGYTVYVRAYATNTKGTVYGNEMRFVIPKFVSIGTQVWFKENLDTRYFRNGDSIRNTTYYPGTAGVYGLLYDWSAVQDARGVCPTKWHVPTDADWKKLELYLGGDSVAGGKMKSTSSLWASPNVGATNSSGFTGLPGGDMKDGQFFGAGHYCNMWSSSTTTSNEPIGRGLTDTQKIVSFLYLRNNYNSSIRCLRDY